MISLIAGCLIIALNIRAHGDHTQGLHLGAEHLVYYEQVADNAFKMAQNEIVGNIQFKKRDLPIKLWKNDLDQTDLYSDHVFLSGQVTDIPGSYIRMTSFNDSLEGIISLPKRGIIRVALASRYDNIQKRSKMVAFHTDDLAHLSKRSVSSYEFWKPLESHLSKRGLRKRQCQPRVVLGADFSPKIAAEVSPKIAAKAGPKIAADFSPKIAAEVSPEVDIKIAAEGSSKTGLNAVKDVYSKETNLLNIESNTKYRQPSLNNSNAGPKIFNKLEASQDTQSPQQKYPFRQPKPQAKYQHPQQHPQQQPRYQNTQQQPRYQNTQQQPRYQNTQQQPRYQNTQQQPRYQNTQQQPRYQNTQQQPRYQNTQQQPRYQNTQQQPRYQNTQQQPRYQNTQQAQRQAATVQSTRHQSAVVSRLTSCNAGLIADYSFYLQHRNQPGGIEAYMQSLFNEVSGHFYSQTGVSLRIKYLYVVKNPNDGSGLGYNYADPASSVKHINSKSARLPGFNAEDLCVVHILSSAKFTQQAVGVAFIGSVCSPGANAGISSDNYGKLSRTDFTSVIMHEIGHVFGSAHDTTFAAEKHICVPQRDRFVMYPSVQGGSRNSHRFSPCSLRSIQRTIANPKKQCWNKQGQRIRPSSKYTASKSVMIVDYLKYDL